MRDTQKKKRSKWEIGFLQGVLSCLFQLHSGHGESVMYAEIVRANGAEDLWEVAEAFDREHLYAHGFCPETGFDPNAKFRKENPQ